MKGWYTGNTDNPQHFKHFINVCTNSTHPPCLQEKEAPERLKHFVVLFPTHAALTSKELSGAGSR